MSHGVRRFTQLRAWQACVSYKRAIYAICEAGPLATNLKKRAESQNHLIDLVDSQYIDEATHKSLNELAEVALQEVTGLMEYLQSPEALRNARRARERRIASRAERRKVDKSPNHEREHEPSSENREE